MAGLEEKFKEMNNTKDFTSEMDPNDVESNKLMGILAYVSWLVVIPLLFARNSKFARFHVNQGLVLAIAELVVVVVCGILDGIPLIGWIFSLIESLVGLVCLIFAIIGVVNVVNGRAKELPFVGSFRIMK